MSLHCCFQTLLLLQQLHQRSNLKISVFLRGSAVVCPQVPGVTLSNSERVCLKLHFEITPSVTLLTRTTAAHSALTHSAKQTVKKKKSKSKTALTVIRAPPSPHSILCYPILNRTRFYHSLGPVTRVARIPYRGVLRPSRYTNPDRNKADLNQTLSYSHTLQSL